MISVFVECGIHLNRSTNEKQMPVKTLNVEGTQYNLLAQNIRKMATSSDKQFDKKLEANLRLQDREVIALGLLYKESFEIVDEKERKYVFHIHFRGGVDANLEFSFPPEYPSDVPPTYKVNAHWLKEEKMNELLKSLRDIYSKNFGKCIMYLWIPEVEGFLREDEINGTKEEPLDQVEEEPQARATPEVDSGPDIKEGTPIWDRGSCFSPYLAVVHSEDEVRKAIEKIESCRKVSTAWRNTYAYRCTGPKGKIIEVGEDGGEPKAGRNLLLRMINYNANNVLVYISRRLGGSMLGSDRFRHLNDAADEVLTIHGYKNPTSQGQKDNGRKGKYKDAVQNKKDKKANKKKK